MLLQKPAIGVPFHMNAESDFSTPDTHSRLALGVRLVNGGILAFIALIVAGFFVVGSLRADADMQSMSASNAVAPTWPILLANFLIPALLVLIVLLMLTGATLMVFSLFGPIGHRAMWCVLLLIPGINLLAIAGLQGMTVTKLRSAGWRVGMFTCKGPHRAE